MNNMDLKINASNLNNYTKTIENNKSKKKVDTFAKLIKLGLASNTSVSDHVIWQTYNGIWNHISTSDLSKGQLIAILPDIKDAIKAYKDRIKEAVSYGLIEEPKESEEVAYTKSL